MQLPVRKKFLNMLPPNPEARVGDKAVGLGRFPSWLHRKLPHGANIFKTGNILSENQLPTVCEEARCPNRLECWSKKTATFLTLGKECTRRCGFCSIDFAEKPKSPEADEPERISKSITALELKHVVLTMVARDDLTDGGASHLKSIVEKIRTNNTATTIELLTSDFSGNEAAWDLILEANPDIFNYNIETVRELTPRVRHKATYDRTLTFLKYMKNGRMLIKSGLMLGLGETEAQVFQTLLDLKEVGCNIVIIGQYLQPTHKHLKVKSFITPEQFQKFQDYGHQIGIEYVTASPFMRSSYNADEVMQAVKNRRCSQ